jgi:hypothetical protein
MKRRDVTIARSGEARPIAGPCRAVPSRIIVWLAAACVLAAACSREPPRQAALGTDVEVGPYSFRVLRARRAPNPPPPISTFRQQPGKTGVVVSVNWKKLDDDMDAVRRLAFIESFFEHQFSIAAADGTRTKAFGAMQARLMYMEDPGANWRDWVVVFHVPDGGRELTLLIENPEPRDGQARVTAVPLGM